MMMSLAIKVYIRALLFPAKNGFADARHCFLRFRARAFRTIVNHFEHALWVLFVLEPPFANRRNPFNQVVGHFRLALDTPDSGGAAAFRRPLQRIWGRKQFMP